MEVIASQMYVNHITQILQDSGLVDTVGSIIELETDSLGRRTELKGLNKAVELVQTGQPVVMISFLDWTTPDLPLADDMRFQAVMSMPNAHFSRLSMSKDEIVNAVWTAQNSDMTRVSDPLAWRLLESPMKSNPIGTLRHDLKYAVADATRMTTWLTLAQKVFGQKLQDELISLVEGAEPETSFKPFAGENFPDIFVDVEGTLIQDNQFNVDLVAHIEKKAVLRPITIWTGGDLKEIAKQIRAHGLRWKLVSKHWMRSAAVACAYDDEPEAEFMTKYSVTVGEYVQI
jgi:hypothetical protein